MSRHEKWRKLVCREPLEQRAWPVFARGVRDLLIRLAEDDGYLISEPSELLEALQPVEDERALLDSAIQLLLEDGFIVQRESGLYVRNLPKVQFGDDSPEELPVTDGDENESPAARVAESPQERSRRLARERQARSRSKRDHRRDTSVTTGVTDTVTERDMSRSPSPPLPLSLSDRERKTERASESARLTDTVTERDTQRDTSRVTESVTSVTERDTGASPTHSLSGSRPDRTDSESAGPIPLGLVERAEQLGVIGELATALRASPAQVRASAEEFVAYWSIGAGTGKARPHWMAKLREHVRRSAERGQLPVVAGPQNDVPSQARIEFDRRVEERRKAKHAAAAAKLKAAGITPSQNMAEVIAIATGGGGDSTADHSQA